MSAKQVEGGPLTVAEMYLASCGPEEEEMRCNVCEENTKHKSQSRLCTAPNVLVVQARRGPGVRVGVAVEEVLDVPGMPPFALVGVVYHDGRTTDEGHCTCLCRGPGGRFWYYDDAKAVPRMD